MPCILFVLQYHYLRFAGGAETQANLLATELARRGWEVHYASEWDNLPQPNVVEGVQIHGLPDNPPVWKMNRDPLQKLIHELKPDVIYNRAFDLYTAHSMLNVPKETIKVWSSSGYFEGYYHTFLKQAWETTRFVNFVRRFPHLIYTRHWADKGRKNADLVLAQHREQQKILNHLGLKAELFRNSHEIVPDNEVQTHQGEPVILWVSSVKQWKRPELFVELARRMQDLPAKFVMIGRVSEPKRYDPMLEEAKKSIKNLEYLGFVPYEQVGKYFAQAHIFVSTSFSEGFSNTFIESWIHGVPVVSLGVDPENLLRDEGLGVCTDSMDKMEKTIRELIAFPEKRSEIGKRAREFSLREFDLKANVDKLEKWLAERGAKIPKNNQ